MVFNRHTSFQLYHCILPASYLKVVYETGIADAPVTLNRTPLYNFADVNQRSEWFDIFTALLQYLFSGESKVGYLNSSHPTNALNWVW